jgi:hypothetical protein
MSASAPSISVPNRFLFMKVGNHAGETWDQILDRKRREFDRAGMSFWGYGGSACHPIRQVQPFARLTLRQDERITLIMEPIRSNWDQDMVYAREFSRDGVTWEKVPDGINVTGSRYALVLDEITPGELDIPLNEFEVGVGPSLGKPAEDYLQGRTDKACFVRSATPRPINAEGKMLRKCGFVAEMKDPFAVLLR